MRSRVFSCTASATLVSQRERLSRTRANARPQVCETSMSSSFLTAVASRAVDAAPVAQKFLPSEALVALLGLDAQRQPSVTADEVITLLVARGHLAACSARLDVDEASSPSRWQRALSRVKVREDSWAKFEISKRPTELCVRGDYDAVSDTWESTETLCKMEDAPFAEGV